MFIPTAFSATSVEMYLPAKFQAPSDEDCAALVARHPFATLLTPDGFGVQLSHLPLLLERRGDDWLLQGHLARANPHCAALERAESTALFHGPQCYVSPLWYEECDVPTWNYAVVHCSGRARLLPGEAETIALLRRICSEMEGAGGWSFRIPDDLQGGELLRQIAAFEIVVTRRVGKFKLSQNRSAADIEGVMRGLERTRKDEQSLGVLRWMRKIFRE